MPEMPHAGEGRREAGLISGGGQKAIGKRAKYAQRLRFRTVIPRHQFVQPVDFVVCDTFQNPCEPCLWIDLVQLGGFNQGEGDSHGVSAAL